MQFLGRLRRWRGRVARGNLSSRHQLGGPDGDLGLGGRAKLRKRADESNSSPQARRSNTDSPAEQGGFGDPSFTSGETTHVTAFRGFRVEKTRRAKLKKRAVIAVVAVGVAIAVGLPRIDPSIHRQSISKKKASV